KGPPATCVALHPRSAPLPPSPDSALQRRSEPCPSSNKPSLSPRHLSHSPHRQKNPAPWPDSPLTEPPPRNNHEPLIEACRTPFPDLRANHNRREQTANSQRRTTNNGIPHATFSNANAIPRPPLTHSVATPRFVLRFIISCSSV